MTRCSLLSPTPISMDLPPKFYVAYFHQTQVAGLVCVHCFTISDDPLPKCTGCRRVAYCGAKCQTKDWKDHKIICGDLSMVNARDEKEGHKLVPVDERVRYYLAEQEARARIFSEATGTYYWHPLITNEVKCQVCFRTPFHDQTGTAAMTACGECKLAWWCSAECEKTFAISHTLEQCKTLSTVRAIDSVQIAYALSRRERRSINMRIDFPRTLYVAPSSLGGWVKFYQRIMPHIDQFASIVAQSLPPLPGVNVTNAIKLLAQDGASLPLTLLAALEKAVPNLATRRNLCIHIVAADSRESSAQAMLEDLLHLLPKLQSLTVILIGPNLESMPGGEGDNACEYCKPRGRKRMVIRRCLTYHDFALTAEFRANRPDLIAGFNTGMAEVGTEGWVPSIRVILDSNVPTVFTMYSSVEAFADMLFLSGLGAKFVVKAESNVWRGGVPKPSEQNQHFGTDHYANNYWLMMKGSR
ncbi:MYND-type domain-containing protein [Mycena kentingensis (nom. inval.)]|nr:MYND-type domain-containing protein [Mycena kentingensis (nom. inval.)]